MVSPLLAGVPLHYVLDEWFRAGREAVPVGRAFLIRYADIDFIMGLALHEDDARRVLEVLPKRFGKYGLTIHLARQDAVGAVCGTGACRSGILRARTAGRGRSTFWGSAMRWGTSRRGQRGGRASDVGGPFQPGGQEDRRVVSEEVDVSRSQVQHATLSQKPRGHDGYYRITGNSRA